MSTTAIPKWSPDTGTNVTGRIRLSLILSIVLLAGGFFLFPWKLTKMDNVVDRLVFTLQLQMFSALTLFIGMVGVLQKRRGTVASNPVEGKSEHLLQTQKNILQNTLEQFVFHFVGQLILCTYLSTESMKAIPVLVAMFVIGRILFKIGYEIDPMQRVVGFGMTLFPTLITYIYCAYCFVLTKFL